VCGDAVTRLILNTSPDNDEDTRKAAAARGKPRYSRFLNSVNKHGGRSSGRGYRTLKPKALGWRFSPSPKGRVTQLTHRVHRVLLLIHHRQDSLNQTAPSVTVMVAMRLIAVSHAAAISLLIRFVSSSMIRAETSGMAFCR